MSSWEQTVTDACGVRWDDAPEPVRARAALVLADTVGAILAGSRAPELARVSDALAAARGAGAGGGAALPHAVDTRGDSPAAFAGPRVDAETAAFVYGTAATWYELDEAAATGVHAAAHVLAAVLAVAQERRLPGRRLLDGFIAGYETAAALARLLPAVYPLHPHGGLAGVGAAAGVAVALRRDPLAPARIAATLPVATTWDACFEGATARHAFAGAAAAAAVRANLLADAGMTGATGAAATLFGRLLGGAGAGRAPAPATPAHPLVLESTIKHHAACLTCHTAIEAALRLGPLDPGEIAAVRVATVPFVADKVDRPAAANELSGKFSLPYAVAAALVHRRSDPSAFAPDVRVAALAERVTVEIDPALPAGDHAMPARVTVRTRDGAEHTEEVLTIPGSAAAPASAETIRAKFLRAGGDAALFERLRAVDDAADCRALLAPGPAASPAPGETALLEEAVRLALASAEAGQRPFGALVVRDGAVIGRGANTALRDADPSAHAEVVAIRAAVRALGSEDLTGATLVASAEPCPMCHALAVLVGVERIIYATPREDAAGVGFTLSPAAASQQAALRAAGGPQVTHVPVAGGVAPFERFRTVTPHPAK